MPIPRRSIHATLGLWLLAAPAAQAQQATLYVMGPPIPTAVERASCDTRRRGMAPDHRTANGGHAAFPGRCLARCTDQRAGGSRDYFAGNVRRACAPVSAAQGEGVPRLIQLASDAFPVAGADTATSASTAASVGTGAAVSGGLGTLAIVVPAMAGAGAAGMAMASAMHSDPPASP